MIRHTTVGYADLPGRENDCALRALAATLGIDYAEAERRIRERNGITRSGKTYSSALYAVLREAGAERVLIGHPTLAQFVRMSPIGTFLVTVREHALAVRDGVILDWGPGPRRRVRHAWRCDTIRGEK